MLKKTKPPHRERRPLFGAALALSDLLVTVFLFTSAVLCCYIISEADPANRGGAHVPMIFVLTVVLISRTTAGYFWGILASFGSVFFVNYFFTYPFHAFNFTLSGYPLTFLVMLVVSIIISAATTQIKQQEAIRAKAEQELLRANLLRAVSHDIRTPLTSIVGASSTLLEHGDSLSAEQKKVLLTDVNEDAQWLIRIVENLLSITRFSGSTEIQKTPELAEDVIAETCTKFRKRYPALNVSVTVPQEVRLIPMDAMLIEQVLFNLMENSARHGVHTSRIDITVEGGEAEAVIRVADDGAGIPPEKLHQLFSGDYGRMWKASPDAKRNMGIGLSVCRSIVNAHGGSMFAQNRDAGGAEFVFTLPYGEEERHENQG